MSLNTSVSFRLLVWQNSVKSFMYAELISGTVLSASHFSVPCNHQFATFFADLEQPLWAHVIGVVV
jgi:hypothetical protein